MNDVKTFVTLVGEIIGRLESEDDVSYVVAHPRLFMQTEQGAGFAPGVCMTGEKEPNKCVIMKSTCVLTTNTDENLVKAWQQQTTGLVLP